MNTKPNSSFKKQSIAPISEPLTSSDNITCPNCGKELPANAKFCLECGTQIRSIKSTPKRKSSLKEKERLGEISIMKCGEIAVIDKYYDSQHITVRFPNCINENKKPIVKETTYANFVQGRVSPKIHEDDFSKRGRKNDNDKKDRIGQKEVMNNGETATIIKYENARNIDVRFDNGIVVCGVRYYDFIKKRLSSARKKKRS